MQDRIKVLISTVLVVIHFRSLRMTCSITKTCSLQQTLSFCTMYLNSLFHLKSSPQCGNFWGMHCAKGAGLSLAPRLNTLWKMQRLVLNDFIPDSVDYIGCWQMGERDSPRIPWPRRGRRRGHVLIPSPLSSAVDACIDWHLQFCVLEIVQLMRGTISRVSCAGKLVSLFGNVLWTDSCICDTHVMRRHWCGCMSGVRRGECSSPLPPIASLLLPVATALRNMDSQNATQNSMLREERQRRIIRTFCSKQWRIHSTVRRIPLVDPETPLKQFQYRSQTSSTTPSN